MILYFDLFNRNKTDEINFTHRLIKLNIIGAIFFLSVLIYNLII